VHDWQVRVRVMPSIIWHAADHHLAKLVDALRLGPAMTS